MRDAEFKEWLETEQVKKHTAKDCISRCRYVERTSGKNLDLEFQKDGGKSFLQTITYGRQELREGKPLPYNFNFRTEHPDSRMADLRTAVRKYFEFCKSNT